MSSSQRILTQPAWLLHHRPFRDSSRILDLISRDHGRLSVVARGARSAKSRLKGILRPFLPLSVSWVSRSDLGTLTGAEMDGAPVSLVGDALLSGYYMNELLLKLMHRHDPQPEIFAMYGRTIAALAGVAAPAAQLRRFEMELLGLLGYGLNLEHDGLQHQDIEPDRLYDYRAEQGAMPVASADGSMTFSGRELQAIRGQEFTDVATLRAASRLMRGVIAYHLDGKELQSRRVLQELRKRPGSASNEQVEKAIDD